MDGRLDAHALEVGAQVVAVDADASRRLVCKQLAAADKAFDGLWVQAEDLRGTFLRYEQGWFSFTGD